MKKTNLLSILLLSVFTLSSCNQVLEIDLDIELGGESSDSIPEKEEKPAYTGTVKKKAPGGRGTVEIVYKEGLKHGLSKEFFQDGKLRKETPYKEGKIDGVAKIYHKNGKLKRTTPYTTGKKNGVQTYYFKSGNPKVQIGYDMGLVLPGIKEVDFTKNKIKQPEIKIRHEDLLLKDEYNLYFSLEKNGKIIKAKEVFVFEDETEWNPENGKVRFNPLRNVTTSNGSEAKMAIRIEKGYYFIKDFYVYAVYKSHYGYEAVVMKKVNFAVENSN